MTNPRSPPGSIEKEVRTITLGAHLLIKEQALVPCRSLPLAALSFTSQLTYEYR
jgi:hypothetical protein